jgi:hypothetical protein
VDPRNQLRIAYDMFTKIGMVAFAERAVRELRATGRPSASDERTHAMTSQLKRSSSPVSRWKDKPTQRSAGSCS